MAEEKKVKESNQNPLAGLFKEKLNRYGYLNDPGFESKREQLYLMIRYGFTDPFIDRFFNTRHHEYVNCAAEELDLIRMAAIYAGSGNGAAGEKYVLNKLAGNDISVQNVVQDLCDQYVDMHFQKLPKAVELKEELEKIRAEASDKVTKVEAMNKELTEKTKQCAVLEQQVKDLQQYAVTPKRFSQDAYLTDDIKQLFFHTSAQLGETLGYISKLQDICCRGKEKGFATRYMAYVPDDAYHMRDLLVVAADIIRALQQEYALMDKNAIQKEDDRQAFIMKAICTSKLDNDQMMEFIDAAENGFSVEILQCLSDAKMPVENMRVLKAYVAKRGGKISESGRKEHND